MRIDMMKFLKWFWKKAVNPSGVHRCKDHPHVLFGAGWVRLDEEVFYSRGLHKKLEEKSRKLSEILERQSNEDKKKKG